MTSRRKLGFLAASAVVLLSILYHFIPRPILVDSATLTPAASRPAVDQELKVAFIGDTNNGKEFQYVLRLIKGEGADLVLHQGDLDGGNNPDRFFSKVDGQLGPDFPYFIAVGDRDTQSWNTNCGSKKGCYAQHLSERISGAGATLDDPNLNDQMYSITYRGLKMVFVGQEAGLGDSTYAPFIQDQLQNDAHLWKICGWHRNQNSMRVGLNGDNMGWGVYETCKDMGAIIATADEQSYHRTRTLTSMQSQQVDSNWSSPNNLRVAPGSSFAFVSGLGGDIKVGNQDRCFPATYPYGCNGEWAAVYAADQSAHYGALFITFNVGGNPNLAHGYFKNISGTVIDEFDITSTSALAPGPWLAATPDGVDFGSVVAGSEVSQTVTLSHQGTSGDPSVEITAISLKESRSNLTRADSGFALTSAPSLPVTLDPGQSVDLELTFKPTGLDPAFAVIDVTQANESVPLRIRLTGKGAFADPPGSLIKKPVADAHVKARSSSQNFGSRTILEVDGSPVVMSYLKFDLSDVTSNSVFRAELRLKVVGSSESVQEVMLVADNNWGESQVKFDSRPVTGQVLNSFRERGTFRDKSRNGAGKWVVADLTDAVNAAAGGLLSMAIGSQGSDGFEFYSKEAPDDGPELVIVPTILGQTVVARWRGNKKGVYTMLFDDSELSQADNAVPALNARGLIGTWFMNPGRSNYQQRQSVWEEVVPAAGHDLANHTMNHQGASNYQEADFEIGETARIIWSLRPSGASKLQAFARGGGTTWDARNQEVEQTKRNYYVINRSAEKYMVADRGFGASEMIAYAQLAIDGGTWVPVLFHGVGDGSSRSVRLNDFIELLDYLVTVEDELWIGGFSGVHKYTEERDTAKVSILEASTDQIRVRLTANRDPQVYDEPLTLVTAVPNLWKGCTAYQNDRTKTCSINSRGHAQYEAIPNRGEILLAREPAVGAPSRVEGDAAETRQR